MAHIRQSKGQILALAFRPKSQIVSFSFGRGALEEGSSSGIACAGKDLIEKELQFLKSGTEVHCTNA
jgi:hypothetical protein